MNRLAFLDRINLRRIGHGFFYAFMSVMFVVSIGLCVRSVLDLHKPTYWGTFQEEHTDCESRRSCTITGTWISDDRKHFLSDAELDGSIDKGEQVRAAYQPAASDTMVHTSFWFHYGPWLTFGLPVYVVISGRHYHRRWQAENREQKLSHPRRPARHLEAS